LLAAASIAPIMELLQLNLVECGLVLILNDARKAANFVPDAIDQGAVAA
jgi:hypothetical protein